MTRTVLLAAATLFAAPADAADWPTLRGSDARHAFYPAFPAGRLRLARHVRELLDGWPWRPFHVTHGISGYEAYFAHPDELFYSLSLARPVLPADLGRRVAAFLTERAADTPPYAESVPDPKAGRARERYDVPEAIRLKGPFPARSLSGVYALWQAARMCDVTAKDH